MYRGKNFYGNTFSRLSAFNASDWARDVEKREFTSGYIILFQGGILSWRSLKQKFMSSSSTKSECAALLDCIEKVQLF